jgi:TRAP-type mannitol/chloroaromatic compound transport system permease small subunit
MSQPNEELAVEIDAVAPPPENLPPIVRRLVAGLDRFAEWTGALLCWLILVLVAVVVMEVVRRYAFNDPSIWAYDVSYMLYGTVFMLGAAVTLRYHVHIRTDLFFARWPPRVQAMVDVAFYALFFFPGIILFLVAGWDKAYHSFSIMERAMASPWRPLLFPFRAVIPLAALLLVLQGVSEFLKAGFTLVRGPAK